MNGSQFVKPRIVSAYPQITYIATGRSFRSPGAKAGNYYSTPRVWIRISKKHARKRNCGQDLCGNRTSTAGLPEAPETPRAGRSRQPGLSILIRHHNILDTIGVVVLISALEVASYEET